MANEVAKRETYAVMAGRPEEVRAVVRENLGANGSLSVGDLDRIKIPAGGGTSWTVPTLEGDEPKKTIEGVIVYWRDARVYWARKLGENGNAGGSPPDCHSDDCVRGIGEPGGVCASCPLSQWGSAPNGGKGQACKQVRLLFMVRPDSLVPVVVPCSPTSIGPMKKFFLRLSSNGVAYHGVIVSLALEQTQNAGGIKYSRIVPKLVRKLEPEERAQIASYIDTIKGALEQVSVAQEDYAEGEGVEG